MSKTRIKICGLTRREDALFAADAGADLLGVVLVPGSPRCREPAEARVLLEGISVSRAMVVADLTIPNLLATAETVEASVIQLHGGETAGVVAELRKWGPWEVWKALRIRNISDVRSGLAEFAGVADGLLLDGWHPEQKGGTGITFSWQEVGEIRGEFPPGLPLIAAGGLRPENVGEAISRLKPDVVDVSSGVETKPGIKDPALIEAFVRQVRAEEKEETG